MTASLRERKKQLVRETLLARSRELFEEHGYDNVTVAQIAEAADVSVKTLFVYFRSKEDLALGDMTRLTMLSEVVQDTAVSPADAIARTMLRLLEDGEGLRLLVHYQRAFDGADSIQRRLPRVWSEFEDDLTAALARRRRRKPTPRDRYDAIKLVGMVRLVTSDEVLRHGVTKAALRRVVEDARSASGL